MAWNLGCRVQVVQHFTELGLEMCRARISSDGGWFVDSFEVQEPGGKQVTNARKLESIRRVPPPPPPRTLLALHAPAGECAATRVGCGSLASSTPFARGAGS